MRSGNVITMRDEVVYVLWDAILEDLEVILGESRDQMAAGVMHHHVDIDDAGGNANGGVCAPSRNRSPGLRQYNCRTKQKRQQPARCTRNHEPLFRSRRECYLRGSGGRNRVVSKGVSFGTGRIILSMDHWREA
jgi:hypothetical protein